MVELQKGLTLKLKRLFGKKNNQDATRKKKKKKKKKN
jgi:hypothetical protein